jgi:hypothetical protein
MEDAMTQMNTLAALTLTFSLMLPFAPGCAVDTGDGDDAYHDDETVDDTSEMLASADAGCAGYTCTITGAAYQGAQVRVSCGNEYTVMRFCYSLEGECGPNAPKVGDQVCLADAPDGSYAIDTQCQDDPCCIPCPKDGVAPAPAAE